MYFYVFVLVCVCVLFCPLAFCCALGHDLCFWAFGLLRTWGFWAFGFWCLCVVAWFDVFVFFCGFVALLLCAFVLFLYS